MDSSSPVLEYKCPCCNAPLIFGAGEQQMKCEYCDNTFDLDTVQACAESEAPEEKPEIQWEETEKPEWSEEEQSHIRSYLCDACAGQLITDEHTVATFCPYCGNPTILPARLSGGLKPDGVIPFKTSKEDAKTAFLNLCKRKPLLPKFFTEEQRLEKITGMYVPFWLYDCEGDFQGQYKATRIHTWADRDYNYTRTDHYHLVRAADSAFVSIPMDASQKMDNAIMESIEPFDYSQIVDFETAYLSGFLADKYDVEALEGQDRIQQRVKSSLNSLISGTIIGYHTVMPISTRVQVKHGKSRYVLLPVWMLHTRYKDKTYVFAMNGQTGKMTGSFPICPKRTAMWFGGIWAGVTAVMTLLLSFLG